MNELVLTEVLNKGFDTTKLFVKRWKDSFLLNCDSFSVQRQILDKSYERFKLREMLFEASNER